MHRDLARMARLLFSVCVVVSLAQLPGAEVDGLVATVPAIAKPTSQSDDCQVCKTFMTETKQVLETSVGPEFDIALFGYFCKEDMGDFSNLCKQLFKTFFEKTRELVILVLAPTVFCPALKFCTADGVRHPSAHDIINDVTLGVPPSKCGNCTAFFTEVKKRLQDPAYEQPMVDVLKTLCLAGCATAHLCIQAADDYGKPLLSVLGSVFAAEAMCIQTGACPPPTGTNTEDPNQHEVFLDKLSQLESGSKTLDFMIKGDNLTPVRVGPLNQDLPSITEPLQAFPECDACRWYMYAFNKELGTLLGEKLISNVTRDVCKTDVGIFTGLCEAVVKTFKDYLLHIVQEETKAPVICPLFDFCAAPSSSMPAASPTSPVPIGYKHTCKKCTAFFSEMQAAWKNATLKLKMITKFRTRCVEFCAFDKSCMEFYDVFLPDIMNTVADDALDPLKTCTTLMDCPEKTSSRKHEELEIPQVKIAGEKANISGISLCRACRAAVKRMEVAFLNATKKDIGGVLTKFCSLLPNALHGECRSLAGNLTPIISQQGPGIIKQVNVCQLLSVCNTGESGSSRLNKK